MKNVIGMRPMSLRWICTMGIGVALFIALSLCVQVPVFENYYMCLGYIVLAVYAYMFGPAAGAIIGVLGTVAYCILTNGLRGMPGWTLGNLFIGLTLGLVFYWTSKLSVHGISHVLNLVAVIVSTVIGILLIKSFTEVVLYAQPMIVRMGKNIYGTVSDAVVLLVGVEVAQVLGRIAAKSS